MEPDFLAGTVADSTIGLVLNGSTPERVPNGGHAAANGLPLAWNGDLPAAAPSTMGRRISLSAKRATDLVVASLALLALGPLLIFASLAIKLTSHGPILFRQTRIGHNGKPFTIYKFRSMYADLCDAPGSIQAMPGDARVTPVGRFIRRTSIDELPQLLNVLTGDMSLVGPRPYVAEMKAAGGLYSAIVPYFDYRYAMKPGVTGWAQANGLRGPTTSHEASVRRVDHDVAYIQNFSLWLDIKILVMTVWRELTGGSGV